MSSSLVALQFLFGQYRDWLKKKKKEGGGHAYFTKTAFIEPIGSLGISLINVSEILPIAASEHLINDTTATQATNTLTNEGLQRKWFVSDLMSRILFILFFFFKK